MNPGEPYQVLADCPHCRVESAVVWLMDPVHPACHLGVPAHTRCRMCEWTVIAEDEAFAARFPLAAGRCPACTKPLSEAARGGEAPCQACGYVPRTRQAAAPRDLTDGGAARAALARWADEEGEPDAELFAVANMGVALDEVIVRLGRREVVSTSFDVIAFLFPSLGGAQANPVAGEAFGRAPGSRPVEVVDREPVPQPDEALEDDLEDEATEVVPYDARVAARALVSVMVADGEIRPGEVAFLRTFLKKEQLPMLPAAELRVWRPHELVPTPDPATCRRILESCVQLAHLDRERDGSEWRIISAYARAWGIDEAEIGAWDRHYDRRYGPTMRRLWESLSRLIRP